MALPKKHRRNIVIDGQNYYWLAGRRKLEFYERESCSVAPVALLQMKVIIESCESGAKIVADFHGLFALCVPSLGFSDAQNIRVTPEIITKIIHHAKMEHSWNSDMAGELKLDQAQDLFPEAVWEGFKSIGIDYDAGKINEYLKDLVKIWP
jgi:hypothetical protein